MTNDRTPVHILGISGSLRTHSYNKKLLHVAEDLMPDGMSLEIFDLTPIPLFNQDLEPNPPEIVADFKTRIAAADGILIATPEYNYSITGVLKNAIDWASRPPKSGPLNDKPLAIIGAGGRFGTALAQQHLRQIASHLNMHTLNSHEVVVQRPWEKFEQDGSLADGRTRAQISRMLEAFYDWILRLQYLPVARVEV
jgi:chromate reductase